MSLPGLGLAAPTQKAASAPIPTNTTAVHTVERGSEWRFEVAIGSEIAVRILSGTAEIFGTELAINHNYTFRGTKAAIYTWHGCRIEVTGPCDEYTAEETPMVTYVNTHFALENLREQSSKSNREGPRVLIVGPSNAGKTSLTKLLTGYAARVGRQPMVVSMDTREHSMSLPGTLTATVFSSIIDVEEGWGSSPTSGPSPVPVKLPLVYYYGLPSPEDNPKLFKPVVTRMALAATSRLSEDKAVKSSGLIIDTPGVISQGKNGYDIISHIISEFSVTVVLVLGSERLHSDMYKRYEGQKTSTDETITVIKLDKSGGCIDREDTFMKQTREAATREYFFGDVKRTLSPHIQQIDFSALTIYKIRDTAEKMEFMVPGMEEMEEKVFSKIEASPALQHSIMAVMHARVYDQQETIRDASVMGFVYVADVDMTKKKVKFLTPSMGKIGDRPLVLGTWPEASLSLLG